MSTIIKPLLKIPARALLKYSTEELWDILHGRFILVFDDGELEVNARETIYSVYSWRYHREYPLTPFLLKHHVTSVLNGQRLGSGTHLELLGNVMWSTYSAYSNTVTPVELDTLAEMLYQITNEMYNSLSYRCEEYVTSLDITDFIEVLYHPNVKKANDELQPNEASIEHAYGEVDKVLGDGVSLPNNPISLAYRSKLVNADQVKQCLSARGYITDMDSTRFPKPVLRGYAQGMRSFHDSLIESRSAAKSLGFSKGPLQQTEYFSRRLQLMCQVIRNLHPGDCGSTTYTEWFIRPRKMDGRTVVHAGDLKRLIGKHYVDDNGNLKTITKNDKHLIGTTVRLRMAIHCAHPDPYGVCSTCFGQLSFSVPKGTNLGQMCCTSMTQDISQKVLSVKHLDGNAVIDAIILSEYEQRYLHVGADGNSYLLSPALQGKTVTLVLQSDQARNFTDILDASDIKTHNIVRYTELNDITLLIGSTSRVTGITSQEPFVNEIDSGRRSASLTFPMLEYIRQGNWELNEKGDYVIDMKDWNWHVPFMALPMTHASMSDHSRDIAGIIESRVDHLAERDTAVSPDSLILELYDAINWKLDVNLAVIDIIEKATMIVSAETPDYSMPKPYTTNGIGVHTKIMASRSLSAAMAFEKHREVITSPASFIQKNRVDHLFDGLLSPAEVFGTRSLVPTFN